MCDYSGNNLFLFQNFVFLNETILLDIVWSRSFDFKQEQEMGFERGGLMFLNSVLTIIKANFLDRVFVSIILCLVTLCCSVS